MTPNDAELRWLIRWYWQLQKCRAKKKFYSEAAANMHTTREVSRTSRVRPMMWSYECKFCGWWHLTSLRPRVQLQEAA